MERTEAIVVNTRVQMKARATRERFILDIAELLSESRNTANLRNQIKQLQRKVHAADGLEKELRDAKQRIKELEKGSGRGVANGSGEILTDTPMDLSPKAAPPAAPAKKMTFLIHADDKLLLQMFSFLETRDVVYSAQVSVEEIEDRTWHA